MHRIIQSITLLAALGFCACASTNRKTWVAPDRSAELRFVLGPSGTSHAARDSYSYYSLHARRSGKRLAVVRSIITDEPTHQPPRRQAVHFSPTGQTILVEEDISDASPDYAHTLLYSDGALSRSRDLQLPVRSRPLPDVYGSLPSVVSITDTEVIYQFPDSEKAERSRFEDLHDRGL
jgi:hypothetical protein